MRDEIVNDWRVFGGIFELSGSLSANVIRDGNVTLGCLNLPVFALLPDINDTMTSV